MAARLLHMRICRATSAVLCQVGHVCFTSYNLTAAFTAFSHIALLSNRLSLHSMLTVKHFRFKPKFGLAYAQLSGRHTLTCDLGVHVMAVDLAVSLAIWQ